MPKVFICSHTFVQKILGSSCLNKYVYLLSKNSMVIKSTQYWVTKHLLLLFCLSIKVASIFYMQQIYTSISCQQKEELSADPRPQIHSPIHSIYEKKSDNPLSFFSFFLQHWRLLFSNCFFLSCCQNTRLLEGQMATFPRLPHVSVCQGYPLAFAVLV